MSVLRVCAAIRDLPRDQCAIPERCIDGQCEVCGTPVHYDPKAAIPALGIEYLACTGCMEALQEGAEPWPAEWPLDLGTVAGGAGE